MAILESTPHIEHTIIPVLVQVPRWSPELFGKGIMTMIND